MANCYDWLNFICFFCILSRPSIPIPNVILRCHVYNLKGGKLCNLLVKTHCIFCCHYLCGELAIFMAKKWRKQWAKSRFTHFRADQNDDPKSIKKLFKLYNHFYHGCVREYKSSSHAFCSIIWYKTNVLFVPEVRNWPNIWLFRNRRKIIWILFT
jgi:hypothetical protein